METYDLALATKNLYDSGLVLFSTKTLRDIIDLPKESTFFSLVKRLIKKGVLEKIEKDKYKLKSSGVSFFTIANFLYQPSYISFETALNFWGILSQFPYEITSATSKKTVGKIVDEKVYSYIHINKELFWGYEKKEDFLMALPEKALLDQIYLATKGLKGLSLEEYNLEKVNKTLVRDYIKMYPQTRQFKAGIKDLKKLL